MKMTIPAWVKPGFWGAFWGAVAFTILGFWQLGWVTGGTATDMAKKSSESAVVAALAPICVDTFQKQPGAPEKLAELKKVSSWQRSDFVEKGGWATMPGTKAPSSGVAAACGVMLDKLEL
ncbi:MAG: hypothetical protein EXQ86_11855 [Rhodospirillales bacterium]|nr:hypothetical protein [Rhodospirillales bacterium]